MKPIRILSTLMVAVLGVALASGGDPRTLKQNTIPTLQTAKNQYPAIATKLQTAIDDIGNSLLDDRRLPDFDPVLGDDVDAARPLFLTPDIIDPQRGGRVFHQEASAADILVDLIRDKKTPAAARSVLQGVVNDLVSADQGIAAKAIADARAFLGGKANANQDVQKAERNVARAMALAAQGKAVPAIEAFQDAWEEAEEVAVPHLVLAYLRDLRGFLNNTARRLDQIAKQGNKDAQLKAEAEFMARRAAALEAFLDRRAESLAQKLGLTRQQVLDRICQSLGLLADTRELDQALVALISRLDALAAQSHNPTARTALLAAEAALRHLGVCADKTPPVISNLLPPEGSFAPSHPTLSASFSDDLSGVNPAATVITLNNSDVTAQANATATGFSYSPTLPDGNYTLTVSIADNNGNAASATRHFTVDTQPPQITNLVPANGSFTNARRPAISAAYQDATSGIDTASVHLTLDSQDVTAQAQVTASGVSFTPTTDLVEGQHTVSLSVSDRAGNPATAQASWTVDLTPPQITNLTPADGSTVTQARPAMSASFSDALSGVDAASVHVLLDANDVTAQAQVSGTGFTFTASSDLANGSHTLTVSLSDRAGNPAQASSTFTAQLAIPDTAHLDGTVYDAKTNQPLAGALVQAKGITQTVLSGADGKFAFPVPGEGQYFLEVTKDNYHYSDRIVKTLSRRDTAVLPVYLMPVTSSTHIVAADGGVATSADGSLTVTFPPGSLPQDSDVKLDPIFDARDLPAPPLDGTAFVGAFFGEPTGFFLKPAHVRMLNRLGIPAGTQVPIAYWDRANQKWVPGLMAQISSDGQYLEGDWTRFSSGGGFLARFGRNGVPGTALANDVTNILKNWARAAFDCVGSSVSFRDGNLNLVHDVPPLRSFGVSRTVGLRYDSQTANPFVLLGLVNRNERVPTTVTSVFELEGQHQEVVFGGLNGVQVARMQMPAVNGRGEPLPTGAYHTTSGYASNFPATFATVAQFGGAPLQDLGIPVPGGLTFNTPNTDPVVLESRVSSPYGTGWTVSGLQRVYPQPDHSLLLTDGAGGILQFKPYGVQVALLHMDSDVRDGSLYGNNGELTGAGTFTSDHAPIAGSTGSLHFDGATGVNLGNDPSLHVSSGISTDPNLDVSTGEFTVECWVKLDTVNAGTQVIVEKSRKILRGMDDGWRLGIDGSTNRFAFGGGLGIDGWGGSFQFNVNGAVPAANQWYYIVCTKTPQQIVMYINGAAVASQQVPFLYDTNAAPVVLGRSFFADGAVNGLQGSLDEFQMVNRALTSDEVSQRFAAAQTNTQVAITRYLGPIGEYSDIVPNPDGSFTRHYKDGTRAEFNAQGLQTAAVDRHGNQTVYTYVDANGDGKAEELGTIQVPSGTQTMSWTFSYTNGKLSKIRDSAGRETLVTIDANGDLTAIQKPDNSVLGYEYQDHRCTREIDEDGDAIQFGYTKGMVSTVTYPARTVVSVDSQGNATTSTVQEVRSFSPSEGKGLANDIAAGTGTLANPANGIAPQPGAGDQFGFPDGYVDGNGRGYDIRTTRTGLLNSVSTPGGLTTTLYRDPFENMAILVRPNNSSLHYTYDRFNPDPLARGNLLSVTEDALQVGQHAVQSTFIYTQDFQQLFAYTDLNENQSFIGYSPQGDPTVTVDPYNKRRTMAYTGAGLLQKLTDARLHDTVFAYDPATLNLASTTDALNGITGRTYTLTGDLDSVTDALGRTTHFFYDAMGRLIKIVDPRLGETTFTYDLHGHLIQRKDAEGRVTTNAFDSHHQLVSVTDAENGVTSFGYDLNGNRTKATDADNHTTLFGYDSQDRLVRIVDPLGRSTTFVLDNLGNVLEAHDPRGGVVTNTYDAVGRLVQTKDPLNRSTSFDLDFNGNVTGVHDAFSRLTAHAYDKLNRRISTTDVLGKVTLYEYDAESNNTKVTDPLTHATTFVYDELDRLTSRTDALNETTTFAYDAVGNRIRVTDPLSHATAFAFDELRRLIQVTDAEGNVTSRTYDKVGNLLTSTDPNNHTTTFGYDRLNRLTSAQDAKLGTTAYAYDAVGNRTRITDANNHATNFTFDELNRLVTQTDPLNRVTRFGYDEVGNLVTKTDPKNQTLQMTYDLANQITRVTFPDATTRDFTYDVQGNRLTLQDAHTNLSFSYDGLDRLSTMTDLAYATNKVVRYAYDDAGRRISMTSSEGTVFGYGYDDADRLNSVTRDSAAEASYAYDAAGRRTQLTLGNGAYTTFTYDRADRLTNVLNRNSANALLSSFDFTLDPAGNKTRVVQKVLLPTAVLQQSTVDLAYDELDRLLQETRMGDGAYQHTWTYDAVGNRLSQDAIASTYDTADQLLTEGANAYAYDLNGNTLSKTGPGGVETYTYDVEDRMVGYAKTGTTASYEFNGDGQRITKTVNAVTTRTLYGGPGLGADALADYDASGTLLASYNTPFQDQNVSQVRGGVLSYYQHDSRSVVSLLDSAQAVQNAYEYEAFGTPLASTVENVVNPFSYTGRVRDSESGSYGYRARTYFDGLGRFNRPDPLWSVSPWQNAYGYVGNNPLRRLDPLGLGDLLNALANDYHASRGLGAVVPALKLEAFSIANTLTVGFWKRQDDRYQAARKGEISGEQLVGGSTRDAIISGVAGSASVVVGGAGSGTLGQKLLVGAGVGIIPRLANDVRNCLHSRVSDYVRDAVAGAAIAGAVHVAPGLADKLTGWAKGWLEKLPRFGTGGEPGVSGVATEGGTAPVTQNAANGRAFEQQGVDYLRGVQSDVQGQVSIRPYTESGELANYRVRLDALGRDEAGNLRLTDFKSSNTAGFTPNQQSGYPLLQKYGGQVVGNNGGAAYPAGFRVSPTLVDILRPGDF